MVSVNMRQVAPRAAIKPPRLSLVTAAEPAGDPVDWERGLTWPKPVCGRIREYDPCTGEIVELLDQDGEPSDYDPVVIQGWAECSTFGRVTITDDLRDEALADLEALTPFAVEREFWTGVLAAQAGLPNRALTLPGDRDLPDGTSYTAATVLTPTAQAATGVSPLAAIGLLEEALGTTPGQSFLHAGLRASTFLATQATILTNSTGPAQLLTKLGSKLVPGSGYLTTGPDGEDAPAGTAWVYGTGPVTVRLSPSVVPAEGALVIDRDTNSAYVRAERYMAATWDGCGLFAVLMALKSD